MTGPLQSQMTVHVGRTKWGEKESYRLKPKRLSVLENDSVLTTLVKNISFSPPVQDWKHTGYQNGQSQSYFSTYYRKSMRPLGKRFLCEKVGKIWLFLPKPPAKHPRRGQQEDLLVWLLAPELRWLPCPGLHTAPHSAIGSGGGEAYLSPCSLRP